MTEGVKSPEQEAYEVALGGYPTDDELKTLTPSREWADSLIEARYELYMLESGLPKGKTPAEQDITKRALLQGRTRRTLVEQIKLDLDTQVFKRVALDPEFRARFAISTYIIAGTVATSLPLTNWEVPTAESVLREKGYLPK